MTRHFESKSTKSLVKESLAEIVASCSKLLFCKVTRKTTQKGPTLNAKFNPLHLYHLKNLQDPGFIQGEIQCGGVGCVNFDKILFLFWLQFFIMSLGPLMINKKFQLDRYSPSYQEIEIQSVGKHPKRSNENVSIFSPNVWADAFNWSFRLTYYPQAF